MYGKLMEMDKVYYSMDEVQELTDMSANTLRNWEQLFPELNPRKDGHGNRYYTMDHIHFINKIKFIRNNLNVAQIPTIRLILKESPVK